MEDVYIILATRLIDYDMTIEIVEIHLNEKSAREAYDTLKKKDFSQHIGWGYEQIELATWNCATQRVVTTMAEHKF